MYILAVMSFYYFTSDCLLKPALSMDRITLILLVRSLFIAYQAETNNQSQIPAKEKEKYMF